MLSGAFSGASGDGCGPLDFNNDGIFHAEPSLVNEDTKHGAATMIRIDEFEFAATYRPILAADGSWRDFFWKDDPECLAAIAEAVEEDRVWTLVDSDGFTLVMSGKRFVNRLEYYITEVPAPKGEDVEVYDPEDYEQWLAQEAAEAGANE